MQSVAGSASVKREAGWWLKPFAVFQSNLQEVDATLDVERVLDVIEGHGADTWLINTGGIASFYPSKLPFQTPNPFLSERPSGDLIGDAVSAAHRRGIRVLSRCDFSKVSASIAAEHPEWLFISPKGEPQIYNTLYSACPSRAYYQERSLDILDEIVGNYPVDGFFFNWFGFSERDYSRVYHGVCHCPECQEGFEAFAGKALPDGPGHPHYGDWLAFSSGVVETLTKKISDHITRIAPQAALVLNRGAPAVYYEANNAFGRELWHHSTAESVSAHSTGLPEIGLMVNSVSFVDMPYRMAGEQPEHFAQYLIQAIARGGNPSTYIMGAPGRIPYANLPLAGEITRHFTRQRQTYEGLTPCAKIAIARPTHLNSARSGYAAEVEEFRGVYKALQEKHIAFDVIGIELVAKMAGDGNLARYDLAILPNLGEIGPEAASALDAFVHKGGNLVMTGNSGVTPAGSVELSTSPAVMRLGQPKSGPDLWSTYVTDSDQNNASNYTYERNVIPVYGSYSQFVWKPGIEKLGQFLPQAPFGPPEKCYGHGGSDDPAAASLKRSGGTVVLIPWAIGYTYREFGTTEVRDHFLGMIEGLSDAPVTATLPEQVEMIVARNGDALVVHLINQTGARRKSFGPHVPINGAQVRVKGKVGDVRLLVSGTAATVRSEGEDTIIDLPTLELFEVLTIPLATATQ